METVKNANDEFVGYNGADQWYRHQLTQLIYTDGVKEIADKYEAYWLIDKILILNRTANFFGEDFQHWTLQRVIDNDKPTPHMCLMMDDGNGVVIFATSLPYTDFKADVVTMYFENETLYLPQER